MGVSQGHRPGAGATDVVVVGSVNADLVVRVDRHPSPGETLLGTSSVTLPGGKGANQAVAAARQGARVAIVGAVGDDPYAHVALSALRAADVDLTHVAQVTGATGLAVVTLAASGENTIVVVPGANAQVTESSVATATEVVAAAAVCVMQLEIPLPTVEHAARLAHHHGTRVLLNAAPATALPRAVLRLADPLVVNEHEAAVLLGRVHDSPAAAAHELTGLGARSAIVTLGAAGLVGHDDDGAFSLPAPAVTAVDTTGAGDAFVGALAAGLAAGQPLRAASAHATRVAAYSVTRLGAQPSYPGPADPLP
ncbi:ribokinase [Cellulomonas palmilytica]|uniref:ribokinase n=1 Tax=Cellulomonas palmilytica TaxID=2608402 RepID=UPI001F187854|nr:ribokinase [Cellulomonas palmilytica]UJP40745.1 ribokinase [Cellulomonas palmilytica]